MNTQHVMLEELFSQNKTISYFYINIEEDNTYIRPCLKTERKPHNKGRTRRKPRGNPVAGWGSQESRGAHNPETRRCESASLDVGGSNPPPATNSFVKNGRNLSLFSRSDYFRRICVRVIYIKFSIGSSSLRIPSGVPYFDDEGGC